MSNFISSSIGKKLILSLSGLFLITFLLIHLIANLFLLGGSDAFNTAVHFMDTNPVIQIMQPILALGFVVHILYGVIIQLQNWKATPVNYKTVNQKESSKWSARNMIWLGLFVLAFLLIHLGNYFYVMKFAPHDMGSTLVDGVEMHDAYSLVTGLFTNPSFGVIYSIIYIIGFVALGLHLNHAFWSAFQTIGWSNDVWRKRLSTIGTLYAILIAVGFSIIPLYFLFIK
ncbi:MAG: succinate dehydrogenase cytochrome b subunit [Chlorobi bacterium]|nr:succinate dehydrogenase cytochrome b subunit [Chlorobiota bacterium]